MAYTKPQYPLKNGDNYIYPVTTADQVILFDGSRLEKNGVVEAGKLSNERAISLTGDVVGTANFDGSKGITINTSVSASRYCTVSLPVSGWSSSAPFTQTVVVNGISAGDNPIVDINMASATNVNSSDLTGAWGLVGRISTCDNSITAYCYEEKQKIDIYVNIMVVK